MAGIEVIIGANTEGLDSAVQRSRGQMGQLNTEFKAGIASAAKFGLAAAAAGGAVAAGLVVSGLAAVDAQAKLARQLGGTINGLKATQIAASDAGISMGVMQSAAEKLNQRIGEAQRGTGTAADSFKRLGIDVETLSDMDVDERMATIADRMKGLGLSTAAAADELRQMGIRNGEMVNLMLQGGDAIRGARSEVDSLGLSLSAVDAAQVEAANDAFSRIGMVIEGISQRMAVEFAPILDAVSKMMVEAGTEGVDMGKSISNGFNMAISAAAFIIDAIEGIKRTFEIAGKGIALFGLGVVDVMLTAADAIVNNPVRAINELIDAMNKIPGIDIDAVSLSGFGEGIAQELETVRLAQEIGIQDIKDTLLAPLPGMKFERFVAESKENAKVAAEQMVEVAGLLRPDIGEGEGGTGGGRTDEEEVKKNEKLKEQLAARLEVIAEANMTERELTLEKYAQDNEDLNLALEQELLTKEEWAEQARMLKEREQADLTAIDEKASDDRIKLAEAEQRAKMKGYAAMFGDLSSLMNTESKKMFEIGKAAALAKAMIDGYAAIVGAYKHGASIGGPVLGAAFGAAAGAATFAQIQGIRSQSFGGGGPAPSGTSTGGAAPAVSGGTGGSTQAQERSETLVANINVTGQTFDRKTVIGLMEQIDELQSDGMRVRLVTA